jgi:hypothetical protein
LCTGEPAVGAIELIVLPWGWRCIHIQLERYKLWISPRLSGTVWFQDVRTQEGSSETSRRCPVRKINPPQWKAALIAGFAAAAFTANNNIALAGPGCPADTDGSGAVDADDLTNVILAWGPCPAPPDPCPADVDDSGSVDADDLTAVILAWGACPGLDPVAAELAGLSRAQYPFFEYALAFNVGSTVQLAVDPSIHPAIINDLVDVYVVANRTAAEWDANQTLTDVRAGGFQTTTFTGATVQTNVITLDAGTLSAINGTNIGLGYDVVIDADQNGLLGAGDIIDGADAGGFYVVRDLTLVGPLAVSTLDYSGGSFLGQRTKYPTNIASMGQLPLVVVSHGNGHNYQWYDYLLTHLASFGYVVMSHQNNTVPGSDSASLTTISNTDYILGNLATIGGGVLNGHVDPNTIIWIGHSRGGEGVVRAYERMVLGLNNPVNYDENDIQIISSIAPTDFLNSSPRGVRYHLLYGSSDGDVCGCPNNDIADSFNLFERSAGLRASTYVQGADHNDFNCCGVNDFQGPAGTAIGNAEAQDVAKGAWLALIKYMLEGDLAARDYLTRQWETLRPIGVSATTPVVNDFKHAVGTAGDLVIDDYQTQTSTALSSSGGTVTFNVLNVSEALCNDNNLDFTWVVSDPMNGMVRGRTTDTGRNVAFDYNAPATAAFMEFAIVPAQTNWSAKAFLSFRAAQGTRHPETTPILADQTFTVILRDANNVTSAINIGAYSGGVEEPYQRTGFGAGAGWQNEYEVIRIRLGDFLTNGSGLDLANIVALRFEFGGAGATARGRILMDDVMVTGN